MPSSGRSQSWARKKLHFGHCDGGGQAISISTLWAFSPWSSMVLLMWHRPEEVLNCRLGMGGFELDPRT